MNIPVLFTLFTIWSSSFESEKKNNTLLILTESSESSIISYSYWISSSSIKYLINHENYQNLSLSEQLSSLSQNKIALLENLFMPMLYIYQKDL